MASTGRYSFASSIPTFLETIALRMSVVQLATFPETGRQTRSKIHERLKRTLIAIRLRCTKVFFVLFLSRFFVEQQANR